jgi:hypothetical protein
MITVGATSNGYVLGEDATALSRMNSGLEDRFKKKIEIPETSKFIDGDDFESLKNRLEQKTPETESSDTFQNQIKKSLEASPSSKNPIEKDYEKVFIAFNTFLKDLSNGDGTKPPKWNQEAITSFTNVQTQLLEYDQFKKTQSEQILTSTSETKNNICSPNIGFLPFDLNITIDGLSGIKVYQKYLIDTAFLPSNYPETLEFIVKGITHTISNNEWITTLESMAIPKNPFGLKQDTTSQVASNSNIQNISKENYFRGSISSTVDETISFLTDVLKGLGIPNPNQYQIQFMKSWRQHEGGKAAFNPLNTTLKTTNSQPYNYVPVRNYPDRQTGLNATIDTLKNGKYTNVINAIKNIQNENGISNAMVAVNNSPWGSKFNPPVAKQWRTLNNLIFKSPITKRT